MKPPIRSLLWVLLAAVMLLQPAGANAVWPLWESYTASFLDGDGRILDHDAGNRTTSEAQSYALFFALVANDRSRFNKILSWTEQHLAEGDLKLNLPSWLWENKYGSWRVTDRNSASDADLWLAWTLLEAGRLWNDARLSALGHSVTTHIAATEVVKIPGFGTMLLPGSSGFRTSDGFYELNPSYLPIQLLLGLAHYSEGGPWREIAAGVPRLLRSSAPGGFVLDWISFRPGDGFSIYPAPVSSPIASYDAIRVYLWAGMLAQETPYRRETLETGSGMAAYLNQHLVPPAEVSPSGQVKNAAGGVGFSAAVLPYLAALNLKTAEQQQQQRLNELRNAKNGLYGNQPRYYDQNLALFATGWCEKRFHFDAHGLLQVIWK
jgi:endoglucanase